MKAKEYIEKYGIERAIELRDSFISDESDCKIIDEYKKSSNNPNDNARVLCKQVDDEGGEHFFWSESHLLNKELDDDRFYKIGDFAREINKCCDNA